MPKVHRVIVLARAFSDLNRIVEHIATDSAQNAAGVIGSLQKAVHSLAILPHRYKVHQSRRDPALTVRSMPVPPYIIYYRVDDDAGLVRVLTLRHGRQRQPRKFD